jgi:hypothetical protein
VSLRRIGWPVAILALAFVLVLATPGHDRGLALFAFLLLAGALILGALVLALAGDPLALEDPLAGAPARADSPPAELSALTGSIRRAQRESALDERLYEAIRAVASVRLARDHGIELARNPRAAREVLGDGLLLQLLETDRGWSRVRVGGAELARMVDQLERL